MSLGSRITEIRKARKMSLDELARFSGVPKGTLSKISAGITTNPTLDTVQAIARALRCTLDDFDDTPNKKSSPITLTGEHKDIIEKYDQLDGFGKSLVRSVIGYEAARIEAQQVQKEQFEDMKRNKIVRLFCYAQPVSAGTGAHLDDEDGDILDVVMNMETARADFCVRVSGHSMEPEYKNGDILLIHAQPDIEEGEDGIFVIDGAGYVKEKGPDCLISKNYNYPDIFPEEGIEIKCLGKVVDILNPYDIVN